jgi:hypothetical protein
MTSGNATPNPKGSATVMGTINGQPVPANDAMGTQLTTTTNGVTLTSRTISITSIANACPCATAAGYATVLVLTLGVLGAVLPTGAYSFPSSVNPSGNNPVGDAHYVVNDPGTTLLSATSGSITISQASSSTTVGSFDLVFPKGDHLTGTFAAPTCAAAEAADAAACP